MRKPDCIFVGYQKSGTTFLRNYMTQHPGLDFTREGGFFLRSNPREITIEGYLDKFPNPPSPNVVWIDMLESLAIGVMPKNPERWEKERLIPGMGIDGFNLTPSPIQTAHNIRNIMGETRIIIMIRNQITWMKSNYLHYYTGLPQDKNSFTDFLTTLEGKALLYSGMYDMVIRHYVNTFGKNAIHVIPLEKLHISQKESLTELCNFLDVSYRQFTPDPGARNTGRKAVPSKMVNAIGNTPLYPLIRKIKQTIPFGAKLTSKFVNSEVINPETKELLQSLYSASNFNSSQILGMDLAQLGYPI